MQTEPDKNTNTDFEAIIRLENITKQFGNKVVLDNLSLGIEKGKTTVIIGPSGCGKTVLIKMMIVLLRPNKGEVYFDDERIDNLQENRLKDFRTRYGFLFQAGALFDSMTVAENIAFPVLQHRRKVDKDELDEIIKIRLALVGLDGYQNHFPASLSGGQKKRVALARAIALDPEVILYDEPTTGLDPIRSDIINELVLKLRNRATSVVVTHDMKSAYKIADRIIMLHEGKIIADGDADYIRDHPHPNVQQFIHGQASDDDLAVLRMNDQFHHPQYSPRDFQKK